MTRLPPSVVWLDSAESPTVVAFIEAADVLIMCGDDGGGGGGLQLMF